MRGTFEIVIGVALLTLALGCGSGEKRAVAILEARSGSAVTGTASFLAKDNLVAVFIDVANVIPPGNHGMHIHEKGDCSAPDAMTAGAHWNPAMAMHAHVDRSGHLGDMGNITIGANGQGRLELTTDKWSMEDGAPNSVLGLAVILHQDDDDGSQPAGNAGPRIACGVIAKSE